MKLSKLLIFIFTINCFCNRFKESLAYQNTCPIGVHVFCYDLKFFFTNNFETTAEDKKNYYNFVNLVNKRIENFYSTHFIYSLHKDITEFFFRFSRFNKYEQYKHYFSPPNLEYKANLEDYLEDYFFNFIKQAYEFFELIKNPDSLKDLIPPEIQKFETSLVE